MQPPRECSIELKDSIPRGSIYTTIMELGPKNHNGDGLLGPNSIMVVSMDPLGLYMGSEGQTQTQTGQAIGLGVTLRI